MERVVATAVILIRLLNSKQIGLDLCGFARLCFIGTCRTFFHLERQVKVILERHKENNDVENLLNFTHHQCTILHSSIDGVFLAFVIFFLHAVPAFISTRLRSCLSRKELRAAYVQQYPLPALSVREHNSVSTMFVLPIVLYRKERKKA